MVCWVHVASHGPHRLVPALGKPAGMGCQQDRRGSKELGEKNTLEVSHPGEVRNIIDSKVQMGGDMLIFAEGISEK